MEKQTDRALSLWMEDAFRDKMFLRKLGINRTDLSQLFDQVNWRSQPSSGSGARASSSGRNAFSASAQEIRRRIGTREESWLRQFT